MSEFVNWMNSAGEAFVAFAIRMLVQSSVLILILLSLDAILHKRVRAVVRYWIWLLVLAKLLLPPSLSSPTSLAWWFGDGLPETATGVFTDVIGEREQPVPSSSPARIDPATYSGAPVLSSGNETAAVVQAIPAATIPTWQALALATWFMVVVVMLVLLAQRALFVRGLVLQSQDAPERLRDLLDHGRRQMKVHAPVRLRLTSVSPSPSVCGLVHPTILIPERMLARLDPGQFRSILLHELAHVRRADLWVNLAQTILQIAYVYHPLVWLANAIIRRVREQAVDETVLAAMGDEAEDYPRTLLSVSKLAFGQPALSLRLVGVVESKRSLTARIRHITGRPFPRTATVGFTGCVLVLAIAATLLPMVSAAPEPARAETEARTADDADTPAASTTLSGTVTDPQGKPVEGAEVTLYELTPGELGVLPNVEKIESKTSDTNGAFSFAVARSDRAYRDGRVIVRKDGLSLAWATWPMHEDHELSIALGQPMELAGEVVDEAGGPVADATVHIAMAKIGKGENRRELPVFGFLQTRTDGKGRFVFADMPAGGTFEFFVEKPLRATISTIDISSYSREQCQFAPGQAGIRLVLPAEARVEGVVRQKADGKPVGDIIVAARADRRGSGGPIPSKLAVTGPDGTFSIGGLAAGGCTVELWTPRGQKPEWVATAMTVSLKAGQTRNGLWLDLTKGGFIEVLIRDPAGKPVEKMNAYFELISQRQGFGEHTDANGLARVRALPGRYRVAQIYRPGYFPPETTDQVTIEEGQTKRVEFTVTPTPKMVGVIRDEAGNPLVGVKVETTWIKMGSSCTSVGESDASGRFDLEWDSGSFGQGANSIVFVARDPARNLAQALDIDERIGPLDLKLKPGLIVTGTVLDQDGKPLSGANARVLLRVPMATVRLGWNELATTGPDGVFEVKGIPPERQYVVEVSADGYGKREIAIESPDPREGRHDIGQVKLALSDLAVSGLVIDPNDEPVAGAEVHCFDAGQPDLRAVQTDAQGRFTVTGLSPGSVHLYVNPQGQSPLSGNTDAQAGANDVKIRVYDRRSAQERPAARGAWLKGKPLPALKDLGIDLPPNAKGKMLLVCFYDMDQRPSRNTMTQLAERTKDLVDKGLVIVAVQSSRTDQAGLNQWIDQNKIPFPVGRIQDDVSKTRSAWGVRSLPWLILTDRNQVVRAEGFDISELQSRIEAVASESAKTGTP
jgi:beta-lactamase regulating signal transducer with metallopeptidase domain/protocatechuate 3,4-dioxygenase beta subunit